MTLLIGVNDQYHGHPLQEYRAQLNSLLQRAIDFAGTQSRRVLMVSIPDWGLSPLAQPPKYDPIQISIQIDAFNATAQECCAAHAIGFVDITPISRDGGGEAAMLAADRLHPSAAMYARWTERVLPAAYAALA